MELTRPDGSPLRVIVVDDEVNIAELIGMALRYEGFDVSVAHTGAKAVSTARSVRPDAVVLDMMLPGTSGLDVCRALRAGQKPPAIVMLTALGEEDDRIRGLELGADDYVSKPFSPRELVLRIGSVLRRTVAPAAGATSASPAPRIRRPGSPNEAFRARRRG